MDMTGEYRIPAPRQIVWEALNDPETLKASIVGCDELNRTGPNSFEAKVTAKVGPVKAKFGGKVNLEDLDPPNGYRIVGEGSGGAAGFAKGGAKVDLIDEGAETILRYEAKADVGGKLAQIGSRLIAGTAKKMADDFFSRFSQIVSERAAKSGAATAPAGATAAAAAPVASTAAPPAAAAVGGPVVETPAEPAGTAVPRSDASKERPTEDAATADVVTPPPAVGHPPPHVADELAASAADGGRVESVPSEPSPPPHAGGMPAAAAVDGGTAVDHNAGYEPGRITAAPVTAPPGPVPGGPEPVETPTVDEPAHTSARIQAAPEPSAVTPPPPVGTSTGAPGGSPRTATGAKAPAATAKGGLPWTWIIAAIVVLLILLFLLT
ncbi:SRPBCC family protein [Geminicoccus roseus]|uniref:SRPBCC family protein n=1 Tax=Geminicoccus roseus TaxID=404900 RepID=UPI000424C81C|nr:carbon monoxide dehydrogenase subunit G [Geminicoccus roseus]